MTVNRTIVPLRVKASVLRKSRTGLQKGPRRPKGRNGGSFVKNKFKTVGIIALVALIGLSVAGCRLFSSDDDEPRPRVTGVTVSPATISLARGEMHTFTATVLGTNEPPQSVRWSVSGGSTGTSINSSGGLVISANESTTNLTITATSTANERISGSATVVVPPASPPPTLPHLTGAVTISGNPGVGQTLTANTAALGGSGNMTFLWRRGDTTISGATAPVYVVQAADIGHNITVTVTRADNSGSVTSNPIPTVLPLPLLSGTVSITGTPEVGQTLTAYTANLGGSGVISFLWRRGATAISGATGSTYVVQNADMGHNITVTVTRAGNAGSVTSDPATVPSPVTITGTAEVGRTLTASTTLGGVTFQWQRGTANISGATGFTYVVQVADIDHTIRVIALRGSITDGTSVPTAPVPALPSLTGTITVTGTPQVGQTLTANTTNLEGIGAMTFQWRRGTTNISDATGSTYVVQEADTGHNITVTVTRTGNSGSVPSDPTATVPSPVTVTGTAEVGQTLTASTTLSGSVTFQWQRGTTTITNAQEIPVTGSTYTVQAADAGHTIRAVAVRSGVSNVFSVPTAPVPLLPELIGTVTITGASHRGQTLTANTTLTDVSFQWQWSTSGAWNTISGETGITYTVRADDVGRTLRVRVTRTGYSGEVFSGSTAVVTIPPLDGTVNITGNMQVGQTLTANTSLTNVSFQWQRFSGGSWITISGATSSARTLTSDDANQILRVRVTRTGYSGYVLSGSTVPIAPTP